MAERPGPDAQPGAGPAAGPDDPPGPAGPPALRASDQERDAAVERLKTGLVEGRLSDEEFDQRMRAALTARTRADLERLLADLPATAVGGAPGLDRAGPAERADRLLVSFKGHMQRRGRWLVPERSTTVAYKGDYQLDLRAARLSAAVTAITVVAYKGEVEIVVPPGVRVQMQGVTYGGAWVDNVSDEELPPDAPVLRVRGLAYKGRVEARTLRDLRDQRQLPPG